MNRTTHRSTTGKKLYAVRSKDGKFKDVQTHKRASTVDQRKRSKAEGVWVRWAVYVKSGPNAGFVSAAPTAIKAARALRDARNERDQEFAIVWAVARIEIAAGVPDPLRRK